MRQTKLQDKLAISPLLSGLALTGEQTTIKKFLPGQIISDSPGGIPSIGLIVSGCIEVYSIALDGRDVQLNSLSAGECFGICNLLAESELETVLRCNTDTEILYIAKTIIKKQLSHDGAFAVRFAETYSKKIQFLLRRIELLTMQSCQGRVIAFLLDSQDENGNVSFYGSREELACYLGVSRAALFRELATLRAIGAIQVEKTVSV